ncbi:MAG: MFS transporter [Alphaproteobacteria bacterium]|nr:MFS transporter [Alphaproteobacteria bacterium]
MFALFEYGEASVLYLKLSGALLRQPDFLRLWAAQTVSSFGARITREGLPMAAVLSIGATPFQLGLLAALSMVPAILVGALAGGLVDRTHRRSILIAADVARALVLGTIPVAAWFGALTMSHLSVAALFVAGFSALFDIADHAYLPTLITRDQLVEGNSKLAVTESVAEIGGPAFAGILFQVLTAPFAIAVNAVTYAISGAFLWTIQKEEAPHGPARKRLHWLEDIRTGWRFTRDDPHMRPMFWLAAASALFGMFFGALYVPFAIEVLHLTPAMLGVTIAMGGAGSLLGAGLSSFLMRRLGMGPAIAISAIGGLVFALFVPLAHGTPTLAMGYLISAQIGGDAFGTSVIILITSLRQSISPGTALGRVAGLFKACAGIAGSMGAIGAGLLATGIGIRETLAVAAAGYAIVPAIVVLSPLRRLKTTPEATH